jgi:hypothetical protein
MKRCWLLVGGLAIAFPFMATGQTHRSRPQSVHRVTQTHIMGHYHPWHMQSRKSMVLVVPTHKAKGPPRGAMLVVTAKPSSARQTPSAKLQQPRTKATTARLTKQHPSHVQAPVNWQQFKTHFGPDAQKSAVHAKKHLPHHGEWIVVTALPGHHHPLNGKHGWALKITLSPAFFSQPIQTQLQQLDQISAGNKALRKWERNLIAKEKAGIPIAWAGFVERWSQKPGVYHHWSVQEQLARLVQEIKHDQPGAWSWGWDASLSR